MKLPIHQSITSKINIKWKKLKSFVTRVFTIITRCFIASTRSFNLPTRAFSLATCAFNLLTRGFELLTREFELVIRRFELVTREFELVTRTSELLTHKRNSCFTFPRFGWLVLGTVNTIIGKLAGLCQNFPQTASIPAYFIARNLGVIEKTEFLTIWSANEAKRRSVAVLNAQGLELSLKTSTAWKIQPQKLIL